MNTLTTTPESWNLTKPAVVSSGGIVTSQHVLASQVGADVLAQGGNAVDAAVATGLAVGTVEPWMSGIGGCGYMVAYSASEHKSYSVEFGVKASQSVDPSVYKVVGNIGVDLFEWPAVENDLNIFGPKSICVPGTVAGLARALEEFGTFDWSDVMGPATQMAEHGMEVDWYTTLKIASEARRLSHFEHSRDVFTPDGHTPVGEWAGPLPSIRIGELARTMRRLASAGPEDFYKGEIAARIVADSEQLGIPLTAEDLASYEPHLTEVERSMYRGSEIDVVPGLTAGPTLEYALEVLAETLRPGADRPDAQAYLAYVRCLYDAYDHRLAYIGDVPDSGPSPHTTHINVVDRKGNLVALTMTLLSLFGSKVTLPSTGIVMNNGMMWFDPRPDRPNSIAPGKRPLSNMCPVVMIRGDGHRFAIGASGGRRIMPAVFQLVSFLTDYNMSIDEAIHQPRLDVSGTELVTLDSQLPPDIVAAVTSAHQSRVRPNGVYPNLFACPSMVGHDPSVGYNAGAAFIASPRAAAIAEKN
ncbi:MAG TPA: gamma-glutamyltransferase [Xanthomonadales bacterium]|nr:gamma-glutamyltransferase [Xanthomonadales bacterium]